MVATVGIRVGVGAGIGEEGIVEEAERTGGVGEEVVEGGSCYCWGGGG